MRKHVGRALIAAITALAFVGCEPKKGAIAPATRGASDIPKMLFNTDVSSANPSADLHAVARKQSSTTDGSVVIWHNKTSAFYVVFDPTENPCNPSGGTSSNIYASSVNSKGVNEVTCTIATTPIGAGPYPYLIYAGVPPLEIKTIKLPTTTDHCEGCLIVVEDQ